MQRYDAPNAYGAFNPGYGTGPGAEHNNSYEVIKNFNHRSRRLNIVAICVCVFVPWLVFCLTCSLFCFSIRYNYHGLFLFLAVLGGVVVAALLAQAFVLSRQSIDLDKGPIHVHIAQRDANWQLLLWFSCAIGFVAGAVLGNRFYFESTRNYYDVSGLNIYVDVDPATMRGQEIMDAGLVTFVESTPVDVKRFMSFKNDATYCVAPISSSPNAGSAPLSSYDFWVVGKNCCDQSNGSFNCGSVWSSSARQAVRVVEDEDRPFYRLAVQEAESVYNLKATHPLFFHWVEDAAEVMDDYIRSGWKKYIISMYGAFFYQLSIVTLLAGCISIRV